MNHFMNIGTYKSFSRQLSRAHCLLLKYNCKQSRTCLLCKNRVASNFTQKEGELSSVPTHTLLTCKEVQLISK